MAKQRHDLPRTFGIAFASIFFGLACQSGGPISAAETPKEPPVQVKSTTPSTPAFSITLSSPEAPDGSIISLGLYPLMEIDVTGLKVTFEGKSFPVFSAASGKSLESLIVLPFNSKPRSTKIELEWPGGSADIPIEVIDGKYPTESLTVQKDKVDPPKRVLARIKSESREIGALYRRISPERYWNGPFALPIDSEITSKFGNKRTFNGSVASFHQGLDLRARTPVPVHAPEGAKVVLAKDLYFTGNTVILDHGYGLFTIYAHLSKLDVKVGDRVAKGQSLGLSGMTGRASGPHLHWGAVLMHDKFNPADLMRVPR